MNRGLSTSDTVAGLLLQGRRLRWAAVVASLLVLLSLFAPLYAQTPEPTLTEREVGEGWLDEMLEGMTTADKVGQLFLVTFEGNEVGPESDIARLVQMLRIGGIILSPADRNFVNDPTAPQRVGSLTRALQELAFTASPSVTITTTVPVTVSVPVGEPQEPSGQETFTTTTEVTYSEVISFPAQSIPLFVAASQEGDGYPYTQLRGGFTALPSNLAVGATWNPDNALSLGQIVGQELAGVGVNLLLGPSLDVLSDPRPGQSGNLGIRVFGGDPYWVGRMGQAYIRGIHTGSDWRVATVAKHLPGLGAGDRSLEEEIATVDKSLQDLRLIELPPFFVVTQGEPVTDTTDALMTAHIRYRGFQGNIRYVTQPISLHPQGLQEIMGQVELAPWRQAGGVLVSDSLGVPAVRRHYSPELDSFPHRQIALDAFMAGNDLLNLSRYALSDTWEEQRQNIEDTVLFFRARYEADETFRARVDQSVRRILALKRRICPEFALDACTAAAEEVASIGQSNGTIAQIAQESVTLLYPVASELSLRLPRPPRLDEDILIFTDAREARECELCTPFYLFDPQILEDTILRLYGPEATGQVDPEQIAAYTFADLRNYLQFGIPNLDADIRDASWIVFAMLDYAPDEYPSSMALKQFLREWTGELETQNIVVMAYEAPYYLDTTEVSKLTAYLGINSKIGASIDASVRALFLEFAPQGRSPVTVDGIGYDLAKQLLPNTQQVIEVDVADKPAQVGGTPAPIKLDVGDPLRVRTSMILDQNGHPVPDGTPVIFRAFYVDEQLERRVEAATVGGVAEATITLELAGQIEIRATSDPAVNSRSLVVLLGETTQFLTPTPTATPTATPTPTPTETPTSTPTATWTPSPTPSPIPTPTAEPEPLPPPEPRVRWGDLALALVGVASAGAIVFQVGRRIDGSVRMSNRLFQVVLLSGVFGLLGYIYYGLGLPGSSIVDGVRPGLRGFLIGFAWGLVPPFLILPFLRRTAVRGKESSS
jgi:beta-N-acetylhexosaminidase